MAALTSERFVLKGREAQRRVSFPLKSGIKAFEGAIICYDTAAAGFVTIGAVSTTLVPIGFCEATVDATAASKPVPVWLFHDKWLYYYDSVTGGGSVTIANLFAPVYLASDHEVTTVATGASKAGIVWSVGTNGIGVEAPWLTTV